MNGPGEGQTATLSLESRKTLPLCQHRWGWSGWGLFALSTCGQLPLEAPGPTGHCTGPRSQCWYTPSMGVLGTPELCYPANAAWSNYVIGDVDLGESIQEKPHSCTSVPR